MSPISDKFGRKLPLFICGFLCCVFHFASSFAPVFWSFALSRAIIGFMIGETYDSFLFYLIQVNYSAFTHKPFGGNSFLKYSISNLGSKENPKAFAQCKRFKFAKVRSRSNV